MLAAHTAALGEIEITKALWQGDDQELKLRAEEGNGSQTLTVSYGGQKYNMVYDSREARYELELEPICYADTVVINSTSGENASRFVRVEDGPVDGFECIVGGGCVDVDRDGYMDAACGGKDCNDTNPNINPGEAEICGDGTDQDCTGADLTCSSSHHASLLYQQYPDNCLSCHADEANDMLHTTHYRWQGDAPDMLNNTGIQQGKLTNAVNSYCINILGNWPVCGSCHAGLGKRPDDPTAGVENIDCLICHSEEYAAQRSRQPDGSMGVANPTDSMVQNVQRPGRANCLKCHATAGGGDGVKRGDLSLATITNSDANFDVHMNTAGANLTCQACHVFENHKVIGKGSDLRPTDDLSRGSEVSCVTCHIGKDSANGHAMAKVNTHVARVACQTCHIPTYAKVATEIHRDWRTHHDGTSADGESGPGHPYTEKFADLTPAYRFWNRSSDNILLGDDASLTFDPTTGTYPTSRPDGDINEINSKLYPFKHKTATQPKTIADNSLIALDTFEYLKVSGNAVTSIQKGLLNMGYPASEPYEWIDTDTYQLLNHGVNPATGVLQCTHCHESTVQMDLKGQLGYAAKDSLDKLCVQCHSDEKLRPFGSMHNLHVTKEKYDCSWCHTFSRPERGLNRP